MRKLRMMFGALLVAACLVPSLAIAAETPGLALRPLAVQEGTSDVPLHLEADGFDARSISSVRVTLSVATADPEDASAITGATIVDAPSAASVAHAIYDAERGTINVILSAGRSSLAAEGAGASLGMLRISCDAKDVAARIEVLGVEALTSAYAEAPVDAPAGAVDVVLNKTSDQSGGTGGEGGSGDGGAGNDSGEQPGGGQGGNAENGGDAGSGQGDGSGGGDAGGSQGGAGNGAGGQSSQGASAGADNGASGALAATGDSSIALAMAAALAAASAAALAALAFSRRVRRER